MALSISDRKAGADWLEMIVKTEEVYFPDYMDNAQLQRFRDAQIHRLVMDKLSW